jgi:hypothetical protein
MARLNRGTSGLVSFAAGFGNGYLTGEKQKDEKKRQDELDRIRLEENERARTNFEDAQESKRKEKLLQEEIAAASKPEYKNKTNIAAEGLTTALPAVFADEAEQRAMVPGMTDSNAAAQPAARGLTGIEKAKHFMENSTPEQQARYGNFYAQQGLSATGKEAFTKGDNGGLAVADKTQAQAKPMWQTMQDRAMTYLTSENSKPEYQAQAFQIIKQATEMKSEEYMQKIVEARKGGLPALLALANGHSNDELPYVDLKVEPTADGKAKLAGVDSSTGKPFEKIYDLKDGSIEDQITQDLSNLASPTMMLNGIARKIEQARLGREEARKDKLTDAQLAKLDQDLAEGKIKLENLPEATRLDLQAKRANIAQSNASAESSRATSEKTREEIKITKSGVGNSNLPTSVREALWYKSASPEQQAIFDQMNDKNAKVTSDGMGGFMINNKAGMFRMDDNGNVTKVNGLDGKEKEQPPKQSTYNKLWQ